MHLNTFAEMPLATSYSPFSFLVVYSIVEPNILECTCYGQTYTGNAGNQLQLHNQLLEIVGLSQIINHMG